MATMPTSRAIRALPLLLLPFALLPWLMPFVGSVTIGNDYQVYSIEQQLTLQFALRCGTFPLFVPGFAWGRPAAALTLGQLYHPISYLAAALPGYWSGGALEIYTLLNLASLGATQYVLYRVLRGIDVDVTTSFLASFLAVYNLRMLDLLRYGASLQNYVGFVLLGAALVHLVARGQSVARFAAVAVATCLTACGGHPQMAYLGLASAAALAPLLPAYVRRLRPELVPAARSPARDAAIALAAIATGVLLSAAYLAPFYFDFARGAVRAHHDFRWVVYPFRTASAVSLVDSILKPFRSDVHGSFAGAALLLIPLLVPLAAAVRAVPRIVWLLWLAAVFALGVALAPGLPLYQALWKLLPGFASFRVPGRTTMPLPFLLALLLVWLMDARAPADRGRGAAAARAAALLGSVALAIDLVYQLVDWSRLEALEIAPPAAIRSVPALVSHAVVALGAASLAAFALYAMRRRTAAALLLCATVVAQQGLVLGYGTWLAPRRPTPSFAEIAAAQRDGLGFHGVAGAGMESGSFVVARSRLRSRRPGPFADLHWSYEVVDSREKAYAVLEPGPDFVGPRFAFSVVEAERSADHRPSRLQRAASGRATLVVGRFNDLRFRVESSAPGMLRVRYPFGPGWEAAVDGKPAPVYRAEATWLGVLIPAGTSDVALRYVSRAAFWGMVVTLATAWALALAVLAKIERRRLRWLGVAVATIAAAGCLVLWQRSLYAGRDLGFAYAWPSATHLPRRADRPRARIGTAGAHDGASAGAPRATPAAP